MMRARFSSKARASLSHFLAFGGGIFWEHAAVGSVGS